MSNDQFKGLFLTPEEMEELTKLWDDHEKDTGNSYGPNHNCEPPEWYDLDYTKPKVKRRHKWKAILLLTRSVFNCEHCGISREKAKGDYCENEEF